MNRTREKLDEPITNSRLKRSNYIQRAIKVMDDEAGNQKMKNRVAQKSQEQDENFGRLINTMEDTRR